MCSLGTTYTSYTEASFRSRWAAASTILRTTMRLMALSYTRATTPLTAEGRTAQPTMQLQQHRNGEMQRAGRRASRRTGRPQSKCTPRRIRRAPRPVGKRALQCIHRVSMEMEHLHQLDPIAAGSEHSSSSEGRRTAGSQCSMHSSVESMPASRQASAAMKQQRTPSTQSSRHPMSGAPRRELAAWRSLAGRRWR